MIFDFIICEYLEMSLKALSEVSYVLPNFETISA